MLCDELDPLHMGRGNECLILPLEGKRSHHSVIIMLQKFTIWMYITWYFFTLSDINLLVWAAAVSCASWTLRFRLERS